MNCFTDYLIFENAKLVKKLYIDVFNSNFSQIKNLVVSLP